MLPSTFEDIKNNNVKAKLKKQNYLSFSMYVLYVKKMKQNYFKKMLRALKKNLHLINFYCFQYLWSTTV